MVAKKIMKQKGCIVVMVVLCDWKELQYIRCLFQLILSVCSAFKCYGTWKSNGIKRIITHALAANINTDNPQPKLKSKYPAGSESLKCISVCGTATHYDDLMVDYS